MIPSGLKWEPGGSIWRRVAGKEEMAMEASGAAAPSQGSEPAEPGLRARVLTRVLAGVVHDVRTPLGTMLMKLQLLRDALSGEAGLSEAVAGHLRVLDAQIERITELVRKVASTIEPPAALGWVDAAALLADIAGALGYEAKLRTVELIVEPRGAAVRTSAEPAGVGPLLLCLVGRVVAATPEGGRLVARALTRGGSAIVELDHTTTSAGEPGFGYDVDVLTTSATALGGHLERGPGDHGLERLTLTLPGIERR
jgi:signal transduction histidine kinase